MRSISKNQNEVDTEKIDPDQHDAEPYQDPLTKSWKPGKISVRVSLVFLGGIFVFAAQQYHATLMDKINPLTVASAKIADGAIVRDTRISKLEIDSNWNKLTLDRVEVLLRELNIKLDLMAREKRLQ